MLLHRATNQSYLFHSNLTVESCASATLMELMKYCCVMMREIVYLIPNSAQSASTCALRAARVFRYSV